MGQFGTAPKNNFASTYFNDATGNQEIFGADTPIQSGPYNPVQPLSNFNEEGSEGNWTLTITNTGTNTGTIGNWQLILPHAIAPNDLGESVSDQFSASFQIFTMASTNAQSSTQWTAVGPIGTSSGPTTGGNAGSVTAIAVDPADPSGNTVYIGGQRRKPAFWKNFLSTTNPSGPTWIPLTNLGPTNSLYISSIALFDHNDDPTQTTIIVGTGTGPVTITDGGSDPSSPVDAEGVGFLRSTDGGKTWSVLDSTTNTDSSGNILPMNSSSRNHDFVGTDVEQVVVDPLRCRAATSRSTRPSAERMAASGEASTAATPGPSSGPGMPRPYSLRRPASAMAAI